MSDDSKKRPATTLSRAEREALAVVNDPILRQMLDEEHVEGQEIDTRLLWRLVLRVGPHWPLAAFAVFLALIEAQLMSIPAWLIGLAIDEIGPGAGIRDSAVVLLLTGWGHSVAGLLGTSPAAGVVWAFGGIVMCAWLLRWLVAATSTYFVQMLGQRVVHDLRVEVFEHVTAMDLGYFHQNPVGRLVNRTTFDVQSISELFADAFAQGLRDIVFIAVLMTVMLILDVPLALILVAAFPLLVGTALVYRHFGRPALRTVSAVLSRMNAWIAENIAGMRENQLYRREARRRAEFDALTIAHQGAIVRVIRAWSMLRPVMMLISAAATAVILLVGYVRVEEGIVTLGVLLTFVQYTNKLWRPVRNLTEKFNLIQTSLTAGERVMAVIDTPSSMVDGPEADPGLAVSVGEIAFRDVRFAYPAKPDAEILRGISFTASPGEKIALVGDTGAGKSTITHLLSRFYDPDGGRVEVDGRDVREYSLHGLRSGLAIVPQDVVVFAGSLRDNIALGQEVDDETLWEAVDAVRARELVERLGGLGADLDEGGRTMSTGERQLLSFARALVANPPILILDEATANIDTNTEQLIQSALERLTDGRTSVVVAHRLSTIRDADQILVLRHGEIVERGDHEALMVLDGEYRRLYDLHLRAAAMEGGSR